MTFGYFWCGGDVWGATQERTHPFLVALSLARRQKTCSKAACPVRCDGHQPFWFPRFSEFSATERIELVIANKLVSACFGKSEQWKSQGSTSLRGYKPGPCARGLCTQGGEKKREGACQGTGQVSGALRLLKFMFQPCCLLVQVSCEQWILWSTDKSCPSSFVLFLSDQFRCFDQLCENAEILNNGPKMGLCS